MNFPAPGNEPARRLSGITFGARFVMGLAVVALGVFFLLDNMGYVDVRDVWRYWPLVFVVIGLGKLPSARTTPERTGALVWIVAGLLVLANTLDWLEFDFWELWPIVLVLIGIRMIWGTVRRSNAPAVTGAGAATAADANSYFKGFAFMSGWERRIVSPQFRGGEATAVMGGGEIDLREAKIGASPAVIDIFAMWGGIDIRVPGDWMVSNEVQALLGGIEDARKERGTDPGKQLIVKGLVIMGGVEIKN